MANAVTSLLSFIVMVAVVFAVLGEILPDAHSPLDRIAAIGGAEAEAARGRLSVVSAIATEDGGGTNLDITIENEGSLSYANFEDWDVNVRYTNAGGTLASRWFPYAATLEDDSWTPEGFYMDAGGATGERLEPGVLNPQEYAVFRIRLADGTQGGTKGWAVITPPSGLSASVFFDA